MANLGDSLWDWGKDLPLVLPGDLGVAGQEGVVLGAWGRGEGRRSLMTAGPSLILEAG